MSTAIPTSSTVLTTLTSAGYDQDGLRALVKSAMKSGSDVEGSSQLAARSQLGTHLHTLTIETRLIPPAEHIEYYMRDPEVNPEYESYIALCEAITSTQDPLVPLTLISPSEHAIGIVPVPRAGFNPGLGVGIFNREDGEGLLDSSEPLLTLGRKRRNTSINGSIDLAGAKEWLSASTAWDTANWLHAILSLDPREPWTRKTGHKDPVRRFRLGTGLQICWEPSEDDIQVIGEEEISPVDPTIKVLITVNVYLDLTKLDTSIPDVGPDLVGLILHSLIPSDSILEPIINGDHRNSALRSFFACMQPAPFLPRGLSSAALQPKAMRSKLLPFQARTLRLLLEREHAEGYTVEKETSDPRGFWNQLGLEGNRTGYRRLTGSVSALPAAKPSGGRKGKGREVDVDEEEVAADGLSLEDRKLLPTLVDLSKVRGTMLCEEMGLGKTVEAIALVLRHRHPLSTARASLEYLPPVAAQPADDPLAADAEDPSAVLTPRKRKAVKKVKAVPMMDLLAGPPGLDDAEVRDWLEAELEAFKETKIWSEESQVNVTEVATTLIVTPPSLLKQWVSEIHAHAPGLRVCVYEGWKAIQTGIKSQQNSHNKIVGSAANERKRKASDALRKKTVKKYAGRTSAVDVKEEVDVDSPSTSTEAEEDSLDPISLLEITQREFEKYVRAHDIVITTYQDLAQDLAVAHPAPPRSRRKNVDYKQNERPRSPLIMVEWWRVIMDEVQLSGDQSAASEMVSLIPRRNSLAVSGTPARTDIKDLMGVLRFLRVPTLPYEPKLWHRLQQPSFRSAFEGLFRAISVRTTKRQVEDEFNIPRQSRYVVPIELSQIEQLYYLETLGRQRAIINSSGGGSGGLDRALLRRCLLELRQICTHLQVGMMQAGAGPGAPRERGQRMHLGRELLTMKEALEKMKNDHISEFLTESRMQMRLMIRLGQLMMLDKDNNARLDQALHNFERCRDTVHRQLGPVREDLKRMLESAGNIDDDDDGLSATPERKLSHKEKEKAGTIHGARTTIRELLLILHQASFLMGDVRHQQGEAALETEAYAKAEEIRKEILAGALRQSMAAIARLDRQITEAAVKGVEDLQTEEDCGHGGIVSANAIDSANELISLMNENALLIWDWRQKIIELLHAPVEADPTVDDQPPIAVEGKENAEEDFYAKSLKSQGQLQMYLTAYAAALMDRKEMMSEERNLLVDVDAQRTVERTTARARQAKEAGLELGLYEQDDLRSLLDVLMLERQAFMDARKGVCDRPLKAYLLDLNSVMHNQSNRKEEIYIAKSAADVIRGFVKDQTTRFDELNKELDLFRSVFNHRVKFFAALQEISDSVAEPEAPGANKKKSALEDIQTCTAEINAKELRLAQLTVKGRYVAFLGKQANKNEDELREDCIICMGSSDDAHGLLLGCGHFFCASCYKAYRTSNMRGCPSCRREIDDKAITRFKLAGATTKLDQREMQALVSADVAATSALDTINAGGAGPSNAVEAEDEEAMTLREAEEQEFGRTRAEEVEKQARDNDLARISMLDVQTRREIAHMDMIGEYGSKIDFLIKHLLHYKARQSEVRHVIFSNWSDSLNIVTRALKQNGIAFASFETGGKNKDVVDKFIQDPSITVFLLHAERESAGLTLTTCQVVHLLEPVLRHSFELQAIGRVDRLGQKKETTVYCYATNDTVESRILALGVRNGTSIYLKADDEGRREMERKVDNVVSAAGKGGDLGGGDGNEEELLGLIL